MPCVGRGYGRRVAEGTENVSASCFACVGPHGSGPLSPRIPPWWLSSLSHLACRWTWYHDIDMGVSAVGVEHVASPPANLSPCRLTRPPSRFARIPTASAPLRALLAIAEAIIDIKQHIVWQISEADRARVLQVRGPVAGTGGCKGWGRQGRNVLHVEGPPVCSGASWKGGGSLSFSRREPFVTPLLSSRPPLLTAFSFHLRSMRTSPFVALRPPSTPNPAPPLPTPGVPSPQVHPPPLKLHTCHAATRP